MSTFTQADQSKHRKAFIEECRQKAWGAACHAEWVSKGLDELMAHYQKLQEEDRQLEADIKESEVAVDYHTVANREKRKGMQERRNQLAREMKVIGENVQHGQQAMQNLLQNVGGNLQVAEHAEKWSWKEVEAPDASEDIPLDKFPESAEE